MRCVDSMQRERHHDNESSPHKMKAIYNPRLIMNEKALEKGGKMLITLIAQTTT